MNAVVGSPLSVVRGRTDCAKRSQFAGCAKQTQFHHRDTEEQVLFPKGVMTNRTAKRPRKNKANFRQGRGTGPVGLFPRPSDPGLPRGQRRKTNPISPPRHRGGSTSPQRNYDEFP
jgi:hypothetical protein